MTEASSDCWRWTNTKRWSFFAGGEILDWIHKEFMVGFLEKPQWEAELCAVNSSYSCAGGQQICLNSCYKCTLVTHCWGLLSLWASPEISNTSQQTHRSLSQTTSSPFFLVLTSGCDHPCTKCSCFAILIMSKFYNFLEPSQTCSKYRAMPTRTLRTNSQTVAFLSKDNRLGPLSAHRALE